MTVVVLVLLIALLMMGMLTAFLLGQTAGRGMRLPPGRVNYRSMKEDGEARERAIYENIENYGTAKGQREVE